MHINIKCFFLGHKIPTTRETIEDPNNCPSCTRCQANEYRDGFESFDKFRFTLSNFPWIVKHYSVIAWITMFDRCSCGRYKRFFWWRIKGNHDDCLPF
jgi:hypothetical protein